MYSGTETRMYAPSNSAAYVGSRLENYVSGVASAQSFLVDMPSYERESFGYKPLSTDYETPEYTNSITHGLLRNNRPLVQFVRGAEEISELVKETFISVAGEELPKDIMIHVLPADEMEKAHRQWGGNWNPGIMGFAINEDRLVFAKQNDLDALMLTVGHEIGHVLTPRLSDAVDEEAKAFAFERAWAQAIVENDIGGLGDNFDPGFVPAANGLHDRAFGFVQRMVARGKKAMEVFKDISKGSVSLAKN